MALDAAARRSRRVVIAFVLDRPLLQSRRFGAPMVQSFFSALESLQADIRTHGSDLALLEGEPAHALSRLAKSVHAEAVFFNEDYEPDAIGRDAQVAQSLRAQGIDVNGSLDHVYFGADEVVQGSGAPYQVFGAYKRTWLEQFSMARKLPLRSLGAVKDKLIGREVLGETLPAPLPEQYGYTSSPLYPTTSERSAQVQLRRFLAGPVQTYARDRDFPAQNGTSKLSAQLRAGTIGIRTCIEAAAGLPAAESWIRELIWRDFYQMILRRFPRVAKGPFIEAASRIPWRTADADFARWCNGETGYPLVDAAMRGLQTSGWMHNRLRMVVASFLSKHLLIDWRRGERYFEHHLADADLAANNGGWQWSASTGNDAVPYFRIFNPILQSRRFDPNGSFVKAMLPQFENVPVQAVHEPWKFGVAPADYPPPIVDHAVARARALLAYSVLKKR